MSFGSVESGVIKRVNGRARVISKEPRKCGGFFERRRNSGIWVKHEF